MRLVVLSSGNPNDMKGVMNFFGSIDYNRETIAELAVKQADALIDKLKEK